MARIGDQVPRRGAAGIAAVPIFYERPSRASRALVIVSALVVVVLAAWVLTPILLINYPTAFAAIPMLRDVVADSATSDPRAPTPPATGPKLEEARDLAIERAAPPSKPDDATATMEPPESENAAATAMPTPLPTEGQTPPGPTLASASTSAIPAPPENEPVATVAPAGLIPWPTAEPQANPPGAGELVAVPDTPPADFGPVPLPPQRPYASSLAQLGTPLPRPRPAEATPTEAEKTISDAERQLFERLSAPE